MLPSELLMRTLQGDRSAAKELGRLLDANSARVTVTGVQQQVAAAYTADDESTPYGAATVTELNALRAAVENLRAMTEDVRAKLIAAKVLRE